jgi:hypothetical protein
VLACFTETQTKFVEQIEEHVFAAGFEPNNVVMSKDQLSSLIEDIEKKALWDERQPHTEIGEVLLASPWGFRWVAELSEIIKERDVKLADAQKVQADLMKKQRELDDEKRELDLTIEKRVQSALEVVHAKARLEAEDAFKHKVTEKEEQIASMQRQIEELKRKAEQGSQQLQGEAQELELESVLRGRFPRDVIEPVPKGEFGGDVLHRVVGPLGQEAGAILWESKRTKNWSDGWLSKLRDDQRTAKAEIALIVTNVLPKGVETFDFIDGVWIAETRYAIRRVEISQKHRCIGLANAELFSASTFSAFLRSLEKIAQPCEFNDLLSRQNSAD